MISFKKYSHVKDLISYYAADMGKNKISQILMNGIKNSSEAEIMSKFIWLMADKMSDDCNAEKNVLGRTDNSDMLPDVEYEITLLMDNAGYIEVWDRISDEENP